MIQLIMITACVTIMVSSCTSSGDKRSPEQADTITLSDTSTPSAPGNEVVVADSVVIQVAQQLEKVLVKEDVSLLSSEDRKFTYTKVDLNGDGSQEIFVGMKGSYFCGNAGCTVFLLNDKAEKINAFTIVNGPIAISSDKTNGWNDLLIPSRGKTYKVKFNGKAYPGNPSMQQEYKDGSAGSLPVVLADTLAVHKF